LDLLVTFLHPPLALLFFRLIIASNPLSECLMEAALIVQAAACVEPPLFPDCICIDYAQARRLRAFRGRRVIVEVARSSHRHQFDLEDVCLFGRLSDSGHCWCIPIGRAIRE